MGKSLQAEITKASTSDFEELKLLMQKANSYSLEISGVPQWTKWDVAYNRLEGQLKLDNMFVMRTRDGSIAAAIAIDYYDERWGSQADDGQAMYLHQLMKDPTKATPGVGGIFLEFAAKEAQRQNKPLLRCDTTPELPKLIKYYEGFGFTKKGDIYYDFSGRRGVLLEAEVNDVLSRGHRPINAH
jgi:hypothetical protein